MSDSDGGDTVLHLVPELKESEPGGARVFDATAAALDSAAADASKPEELDRQAEARDACHVTQRADRANRVGRHHVPERRFSGSRTDVTLAPFKPCGHRRWPDGPDPRRRYRLARPPPGRSASAFPAPPSTDMHGQAVELPPRDLVEGEDQTQRWPLVLRVTRSARVARCAGSAAPNGRKRTGLSRCM
jgi:hypothetical protein